MSDSGLSLLNDLVQANRSNFWIYLNSDSGYNKGFPSGFFANPTAALSKIHLNTACVYDPQAADGCSTNPAQLDKSRGTVMRITFDPLNQGEFAGINIEEPENWGVLQTGIGYDLRGATRVCFDALSTSQNFRVRFGVGGLTGAFVNVPPQWTNTCLDLAALGLDATALSNTHILFTIVTNDMNAASGGTVLLDNIHFDPVPDSQKTAISFPLANQTYGIVPAADALPGRVPIPPDQVLPNLTTIYESSMALLALLARGTTQDLASARQIADAFVYALNHDNQGLSIPAASDGSTGLHNAMMSGDLALHNDQGPNEGKQGQVRLAGFSIASSLCGPTHFCLVLDGATGGNSAFAMIALEAAYQKFQDVQYLNAARTLGNWIYLSLLDQTGNGFGGYYLGYPDQGQPKILQKGKSVENNADIYRAMATLGEITTQLGLTAEAQEWNRRAQIAGDFVIAMLNTAGRFNAGTVPVGTAPGPGIQPDGQQKGNDIINTADFLDAQTFTTLALAQSSLYRNAIDWRRPVQWMLEHDQQTITAAGQQFQGFSLVAAPTSGPNSINWEFTGQAVVTMRFVDGLYGEERFENQAQFFLGEMRRARLLAPFGDGRGLVAAIMQDGDTLPPYEQCASTPFQCIAERVGLAATTWAVLSELNVNMFVPASDGPVLTNASVSPSVISGGGVATLSVTIASTAGASSVQAQITNPDFSITVVPLTLQTGTINSGTWAATFNIPTDLNLVGKNYLISFSATDAAGNSNNSPVLTLPIASPGPSTPTIALTDPLPAFGSFSVLRGQAFNVDPSKFQVAVLIFISGLGWFSKPTCAQLYVPLAADGTWSANVTTGGVDPTATAFAAYLVPLPANFNYSCTLSGGGPPSVLDQNAAARVIRQRPNPNERIINFAGYTWGVKSNSVPLGPGPNNFSDSTQNVFVDAQGALHLRITNVNGNFFAAEIYSKQPVGYGTYSFDVISSLDTLDSNLVAGFFTWTENPAFSHREIDFEASRFNQPADPTNAQFVVQPFNVSGNRQRFTIPSGLTESTYGFHWAPSAVSFQAVRGSVLNPADTSLIISQFTVPAPPVPAPDEQVRMNLWIFNPPAPNNGQPAEVIVRNFQYVPDTVVTPSPTSLDFGTQNLGTASNVLTLTVANNGSAPAQIFQMKPSGDFSIDPATTTCSSVNVLPAQSSCVIGIRFNPTALGQRTGTLTLTDNTAQGTHTVALSGVGETLLSVAEQGTGTGTVSGNDGVINCGPTCSASYTTPATVVLTATPAPGSTFDGWSGACSGTQTCTVTMDASRNVSATFTALPPSAGLRFVPVTPCRVVDTRNPNGPFGGPFLSGKTSRAFTISNSSCGIPASAQAFSLNYTVVPKLKLAFLTTYPCGQSVPLVSTLNSDGRIKAGAAITPAGTNGAVCVFATDDTELIMDIDGYFVPAANPSALAFYPVAPCRLVDTRLATGPLGGPTLAGNTTRTFPLLSSSCNVPSQAQAYSLNFTVVPRAAKLDFLTTWPAGNPQPVVSTLNASTGTITANAAIVPAGTGGAISVFVTQDTDLVIDINGYFAPPSTGGLSLFNLPPCRVLDTRIPAGSPPILGTLPVNVASSPCSVPGAAQAYVLNATVVPSEPLDFLTLWSGIGAKPLVSTLNASDSAITSNMAIVPTTNGSISAFVPQQTHLVLDISGYMAP